VAPAPKPWRLPAPAPIIDRPPAKPLIGPDREASLSVGLGAFVETQTTSGEVGAAVTILGNNLTSATSVTFNGTAATFTVVSASEITATVPTGATTGFVEVTTSGGVLQSNVVYTVKP
jgi:IPT/TIG domain